jgi:hypothetical protein
MFKNSVPTSKKTKPFTITKIKWLMLLREITTVYSENHTKPLNTVCVTEFYSIWYIQMPVVSKQLTSKHELD